MVMSVVPAYRPSSATTAAWTTMNSVTPRSRATSPIRRCSAASRSIRTNRSVSVALRGPGPVGRELEDLGASAMRSRQKST